jgi:hypothetical protein
VEKVRPDAEIASRPPLIELAHDLHVLPRHRLLPQAHGFEGLFPRSVLAPAHDFGHLGLCI